MAVVQSTYDARQPQYALGQIVNQELHNSVSRVLEDATAVGYARALFAGAADNTVTATQTLEASSAALGTNTGNGTMGTVTVSGGAVPGRYTLTIVEPGSNVGTFIVTDPNGQQIGDGVVASAFSAGGLAFTLADGSTDFVAGDSFAITVSGNAFEGVTIRDVIVEGTTADTFEQGETLSLCKLGVIAVQGAVAVAKGDQAYVTSAGAWTNVASGNILIPGATFDGTTSGAGLVALRIK